MRAAHRALWQARQRARRVHEGDVGALAWLRVDRLRHLPPALKRSAAIRGRRAAARADDDAQIRELRAGRLDLAIGLAPVDEPDLRFERVLREALVLAAPADHPAVQGEGAVDLRVLARDSFIVPPRDIGPGLYDLIISRCRAAGFVPRITQSARQMQTIIGLVSSGMGVALVPASVQQLQRAGVQYRPLRGRPAQIELAFARRQQPAGGQLRRNPASRRSRRRRCRRRLNAAGGGR